MLRFTLTIALLLTGCATGGYYRQPSSGGCIAGKRATRGNCGLSRDTTPQEGVACSSNYDCTLGQFCRKAGYSFNGVCVNNN